MVVVPNHRFTTAAGAVDVFTPADSLAQIRGVTLRYERLGCHLHSSGDFQLQKLL
jgi:hypothetical protein